MSRGPSLFWCNIWIIIHILRRVSKEAIIIVADLGTVYLCGDSDDWIEPQTIETFIGAALKTEADIVIARYCSEYMGSPTPFTIYLNKL